MKKISFLLVSIIAFSGCSSFSSSDKTGDANIVLVEKYIDAVQSGDYETMGSMIADDYIGIGPSMADTINKVDGLASWAFNLEHIYENIEYNRSRNIAVTITDGDHPGDWVSNWGLVSINFKDGSGPVKILANTLYKIENDKIAETLTIYNEYDVFWQLGL